MNLLKRVGIASAFQLFFLCLIQAQNYSYTNSAACILAMDAIKKLQLDKAREILATEHKNTPNNIAVDYLDDCVDYYELITSGDKVRFGILQKNKDKRIAKFQKLSPAIAHAAYAEAEVNLHWAVLKLMQNEYISGAVELRTAYQLHQRNAVKYPQYISTLKSLGFIKGLLGTLPENYNWVLNIVGLKGDFKEGLKLIDTYFEKIQNLPEQVLDKQQADFYFTLMQFYFGSKQLAWNHTLVNTTDYADNMLSCYLRAFIASHTAHNDEAIAVLNKRPKGSDFTKYPEMDFVLGFAKLNKLEPEADIEFKKFVTFSKNNTQKKEAYRRLSWSELIQYDTLKYMTYRRLAFHLSNDKDDEDLQVDKDLEKNIYPNIDILKARLLFDGGYYVQAENIIKEINKATLLSPLQSAEYYYRYGRIMQEQRKFAKAIECFTESIKVAEKLNIYFAPFSALQLGNVYSSLGYGQTALFYYNKAIGYKNYKDQGSIAQKAKQAIANIK